MLSLDVKGHCHTNSMKSSEEIDKEELHTHMCIRIYVSTTQTGLPYAILLRVAEILHAALRPSTMVHHCNEFVQLLCIYVHTIVLQLYGTFHKKLDDERRSVCVRTVTVRALTAVRTAYVRVLFVPTRFLSL